jgi:DNA-binding LacI/PurR family transcriptional regulator
VAGKVTIYDVATAAGVSASTVSLALNRPNRVGRATRERVFLAADELGFVPNVDAVTRARRGVGRIGVIAPFGSSPSFARRLTGVLAAVREKALEVVVFDQQAVADAGSPVLASLPITWRLDGLIIMALPIDEVVAEQLQRQRLPAVLVDAPRPDFDCVSIDDHGGGQLVAQHLYARGHRCVGLVGEEQHLHTYTSPSDRRLSGFRQEFAALGISLPDSAVRLVGHSVEEACAAAHGLLDAAEPSTALFASDDLLAAGVLRAAHQRELSVPDELAVVGFDDGDIAQALDLTTVRAQFEESGQLAARALLELLPNAPAHGRNTVLRARIVVRSTT